MAARGRPSLQPGQGADRSLCQGHRGGDLVERRHVRPPGRRSGRRPDRGRARQCAVSAEERGRRPRVHVGRRPAAAHAVARHGDLRGPRQGLHRAPARRAARQARDLLRPRLARRRRAPEEARRHRRRAPPRAPLGHREGSARPRAHQLLGLQLDRLLRPRRAVLVGGRAGRPGRRVQDDGEDAPPGGHRGHPGRRVQPHRRGRSPRARRSATGASTMPPTIASTAGTGAATSTTRAAAIRST